MNVVSWFVKKITLLALMIVVYAFSYSVGAASVSTQVTVSNTAPDFTVAPAEDPISSATAPTNVGNAVTIKATATDTNGDAYRFAACKTNAITPNGASAPTCTGGNWCISASTTSGQQASCSYTVLSGDAEVNVWYGFVCDVIAGGTCSAVNQGSGDSGSPFYVNHTPSFTQMTASTADPGGTITFTSTASDADIDTAADTVHLIVCSVAGATSNGCTLPANQLCISSTVATNPTCDYVLPAVKQSGSTSYYAYVYDSHNLGATNNPFPSRTYIVNNVAPAVSNVIVNGAEDIQLTAGSTTAVIATATITDSNSCQNISTVKTSLYRSGIGYSACDTVGETNYNYCYALQSCAVVGGTCTSATDASADYACTVAVQFHADPTDVNTPFVAENWLGSVLATDSGALTANAEVTTPFEVLSLTALSVDANITYGNIGLGQDTGATNATTIISAVGNVGIDTELSGTDMSNGTDTIPIANQKYNLLPFTYSLGGTAMSVTPTEVELNVTKTLAYATPAYKNISWGIAIPNGISTGTYTGTNNITAVKGEVGDW